MENADHFPKPPDFLDTPTSDASKSSPLACKAGKGSVTITDVPAAPEP
jgi:hypothetical protein